MTPQSPKSPAFSLARVLHFELKALGVSSYPYVTHGGKVAHVSLNGLGAIDCFSSGSMSSRLRPSTPLRIRKAVSEAIDNAKSVFSSPSFNDSWLVPAPPMEKI